MCFVILAGWFVPRATLAALWLLTQWVHAAVHPWWLGVLGWLALPYTTLTYVLIHHQTGQVDGTVHLIILIAALSFDLGVYSKSRRRKDD